MLNFTSCEFHTVGTEWELQLIDSDTLDLTPGIGRVKRFFADNEFVKPEFIQSCVELNSPVAERSAEIEAHFLALTREVQQFCRSQGLLLAGTGTHPFCRRLALITPLPRYKSMASSHGYIGQSQLAFATHVHVGMSSGDEAIRTMRYLTPCLPLLIALGANSPFWRGHETGFASYRRRLLAASRSYGLPPYFSNWDEFCSFYDMAVAAGSIETIKDIHWDIRPHPDFGTLECRVTDAQSTVAEVAFIAGLVRLIIVWIKQTPGRQIESIIPRRLSPWADRENHFRASHWGLEAALIHNESGKTRRLVSYLNDLVESLQTTAQEIGEAHVVEKLDNLSAETAGYWRQREAFQRNGDVREVVNDLRTRLDNELELGA